MGLSLHRFSRVPGESWMVFSCLLGLAGVSMPVISRVVFLGIFEPRFLWLVVCRFRSFGYDGRFCLNVLLVVLLSIFELIGLSSQTLSNAF